MLKLYVCIGSACHLKGSYNVIQTLQHLIEEKNLGEKIELNAVFCLGHCTQAVSVRINEGEVLSVSPSDVQDFFIKQVLPLIENC